MTAELPGKLQFTRLREEGRRIAEWTFQPRLTGDHWQSSVEVGVYLRYRHPISVKTGKYSGFYFIAMGWEHGFIESDSLQDLFNKVEETLKVRASAMAGINWEKWIEVTISGNQAGEDSFQRGDNNLDIKTRDLLRGTDDKGQTWLCDSGFSVTKFPESRTRGTERGGYSFNGKNSEISYVPATPENVAALARLNDGLNRLRDQLSDFMSQSKITGSLSAVVNSPGSVPLLK